MSLEASELILTEIRDLDLQGASVAMTSDDLQMALVPLHRLHFGWGDGDIPVQYAQLADEVNRLITSAITKLGQLGQVARVVDRKRMEPIVRRLEVVSDEPAPAVLGPEGPR